MDFGKKWSLDGRNGKLNSQNIEQKDIIEKNKVFNFNENLIDVYLIEVKINFNFFILLKK